MPLNEDFSSGMISLPDYQADIISALKVTPIIFMIDVSESMRGENLGIVNSAMEEILNEIKSFNSSDSEIRFAVLSFGTNCTWETGEDGLAPCNGIWKDLSPDGLTYFNTACRELNRKLSSTNGFFKFATGRTITPPVLFLLTDGYANDGNHIINSSNSMNGTNGDDGIELLKKNKYFLGSYRIALAVGDNSNKKLCYNFTGDKNLVFRAYDSNVLKNAMKIIIKQSVAVSSSGISKVTSPDKTFDENEPCKDPLIDGIHNEIEANNLKDLEIDFDDWD